MSTLMKYSRLSLFFVMLVCWVGLGPQLRAGDLNPPPGPIGPTMQDLSSLETRIPVSLLPFTINQSGSYYLTRNLTGATAEHGIVVHAPDVVIDLNGFTLSGGGVGVDGIRTPGSENIVVRNGNVRDWTGRGISLAGRSEVSHVRVLANNSHGIIVGSHSRVIESMAIGNGEDGIQTGDISLVYHCTAVGNGAVGIRLNGGCEARQSLVRNNNVGISTGAGGVVTECTVSGSATDGIVALFDHNRIVGNQSTDNQQVGIHTLATRNLIEGNSVSFNVQYGIKVDAPLSIIVRNFAFANPSNYTIASGNTVGVIVIDSASLNASQNSFSNISIE